MQLQQVVAVGEHGMQFLISNQVKIRKNQEVSLKPGSHLYVVFKTKVLNKKTLRNDENIYINALEKRSDVATTHF